MIMRIRVRGAQWLGLVAALVSVATAVIPAVASADAVTDPPVPVSITTEPGQVPAPGYFFVDPYQLENTPVNGPEIVDNQGRVIWYDAMPKGVGASNFQVQSYEGQRVLTWWQGTTGNPAFGAIGSIGIGQGEDVVMNSHYKIIATFKGAGGLQPDAHEFTLTPQGDALVTAYSVVPARQAEAEYPQDASLSLLGINVVDSHALVVDMKTGKVLMDWDALAHVPLTDSNSIPLSPWDYFHINSISVDPSGNLLIDSRNTFAMYDVNPQSGAVNWQLGGRGSTFTLGPGVQFSWQHDPRFVSANEITLFDDGSGYPGIPTEAHSRAEWIELDTATHTATLAKQIAQPTGQSEAWSQGSVQPLSNGGSVVGWGSAGTFTEYSPSGALALFGRLPGGPNVRVGPFTVANNWNSYRTFKEAWAGSPATPPVLAVQPTGTDSWTISAAWNGDTQLERWRLLAGPSRSKLKPVETVAWTGLNTELTLTGARYRYVKVEALGTTGPIAHGSSRVAAL
jgi:hypothetical protein